MNKPKVKVVCLGVTEEDHQDLVEQWDLSGKCFWVLFGVPVARLLAQDSDVLAGRYMGLHLYVHHNSLKGNLVSTGACGETEGRQSPV